VIPGQTVDHRLGLRRPFQISVLADDANCDYPHELTEAMIDAFALIRQATVRAAEVTS
jgi:hypothetical protein